MFYFKLIIISYFALTNLLSGHSNKKKSLSAHEHGLGTLNISQEGKNLLFEFEAPGFDIVGFEYVAKKEEDKIKVENALLVLSDYKNVILPSSSPMTAPSSSGSNLNYLVKKPASLTFSPTLNSV